MSRNRRNAMKRGTVEHDNYVTRQERRKNEDREVRAHGNRQMMADAVALAAHEQLGFSGKRIQRFINAVSDKLDLICKTVLTDYKTDKTFEYGKADYDAALQQALGKDFVLIPFDERFCPEGWECADKETITKIAEELGAEARPMGWLETNEVYRKGYEAGLAAGRAERNG